MGSYCLCIEPAQRHEMNLVQHEVTDTVSDPISRRHLAVFNVASIIRQYICINVESYTDNPLTPQVVREPKVIERDSL